MRHARPHHVNDAALAAHHAALAHHRGQPPVAVRSVGFGQAFMIDSAPGLLFVRVRDNLPIADSIPVVVIATGQGQQEELGVVIGLLPLETVRLTKVTQPMMVELA